MPLKALILCALTLTACSDYRITRSQAPAPQPRSIAELLGVGATDGAYNANTEIFHLCDAYQPQHLESIGLQFTENNMKDATYEYCGIIPIDPEAGWGEMIIGVDIVTKEFLEQEGRLLPDVPLPPEYYAFVVSQDEPNQQCSVAVPTKYGRVVINGSRAEDDYEKSYVCEELAGYLQKLLAIEVTV